MTTKFKIKLLTARVSATESHAAGEVISVGNDEAWRMINVAHTGELVGKQAQPEMPAAEKAELEKRQQAEEEARLAAEAEENAADSEWVIAELRAALAQATEKNQALEAELAELKPAQADLLPGGDAGASASSDAEQGRA